MTTPAKLDKQTLRSVVRELKRTARYHRNAERRQARDKSWSMAAMFGAAAMACEVQARIFEVDAIRAPLRKQRGGAKT